MVKESVQARFNLGTEPRVDAQQRAYRKAGITWPSRKRDHRRRFGGGD